MSFKKSELCKACKIKQICHEPQKHFAKSCQHFIGDIPEGFYFIETGACQFIPNRWKGNKGYFVYPWGRKWVTHSQFEWALERGNRRQEDIEKRARTDKKRIKEK